MFLRYKHGYRKDTFAKAHSSLAALYGNIIPYPSVEWQGFPWICLDTFCSLSWIHALILYFSDINAPRVGSRRGTAQGAALLTKWGETAIIEAERALLLAVGSTRFAQIDYADRLAPPRRSVCFYRTERAPLLAVGFPYQLIIIMLTVQLPLGGQHAFMESASAKNTTHSRNFKKICPFQLHPLPTWILRGASQPLFVTTLLSGPFDGAFLS